VGFIAVVLKVHEMDERSGAADDAPGPLDPGEKCLHGGPREGARLIVPLNRHLRRVHPHWQLFIRFCAPGPDSDCRFLARGACVGALGRLFYALAPTIRMRCGAVPADCGAESLILSISPFEKSAALLVQRFGWIGQEWQWALV
jgi:hypothetical protein